MKFDWRTAAIVLLLWITGLSVFAGIVAVIDSDVWMMWGAAIAACIGCSAAAGLIADW